jgi:hypothetical protein
MKDYRQLLKELPSNTIVLACSKFNPPTIGHELLIKAVKYACQDIDRMKRAEPKYSYRVVERRNGKIVGTIYSC